VHNRVYIGLLATLSALAACHKDGGSGDNVCSIRYELVGGEESARVDYIFVSEDGRSLSRAVHSEGQDEPDEAIYIWFDGSGDTLVEALDLGADGALEGRSDAQPRVAGFVTPFVIDLDTLSDGVDLLQLSIDLPSSRIGPWNPTRIYYQAPCDQGEATVIPQGEGRDRIELNADSDAAPETVLNVERSAEGALQAWTVDTNNDGEPEDTATLVYNERGQIREVYWTRPGFFLGDTYVQSRFVYDTDGNLFRWDSDSDGDGLIDTRIVYSAACFEEAP
jgi:hypothetical protein